ncbi:MAG: tetratricopeptide repeat protein [Anaerolineaceae bacterium]|nr:tetratricopeptide repeat protein [Anaerolineaceae bacterium]
MQVLRVHLLGEFRLYHGDQSVTTLNTARLQSLLAYLVLHRGQRQPRYHLAFQFWPDSSESQAHTNLRHLLHLLRRALPDADDWLCVDGATLLWRAEVPCELDVVAFERAVAGGRPREAIDLYRGDLLPSCYDDWIVPERERLHQLLLQALEQVIREAEEGQDYRTAIAHAQRLLRIDPLREETHRHLIRLHALAGDRIGVVRAYDTCATVLRRELDIEPTAETRETYRCGLTMAARHSTTRLPSMPTNAGPNNLPLSLTRFIGREREKGEVERLVATHRLLTLTGAGGVGKTRLAIAVASELCGVFADGVWHVDLAPLSDPALVAQAVATALGIGEAAFPLLPQLIAHLQPKHTLLILDNCERLVEAVRGLAEALLGAAPRLHLLVTSRAVVGAGGEVTWRVPSLPIPDLSHWTAPAGSTSGSQAGDDEALAALCRNASVQVFADRAAAVLPTFTVTAGNARAVGLVCRRLDGVPLALELAAARVKVLSVQQIAGRLQDALRLLSSGSPGAPPHQQTMRATMDWSHALLTAAEQALFRRLSVFVRGASFEAVEGVCCGEGISEADVLDLLSSVVDKSLVSVELAADEETRFRLHEVARQYAYARLVEAGEEARVRNRHLAFFCRLAEALEPDLLGKMPAGAAASMMREHDNLRAALEWSTQEGGDAQLGLQLAAALPGYWELSGLAAEERNWLRRLLATAGRAAPPAMRARALRAAGKLAYYQCDFCEARSSFEQSLMLDRELDNKPGVADTLARLGFMFSVQQDYAAAEGVYRESLALSQALGDRSAVARLLSELGYTFFRQGDHAQARSLLEESLAMCRDPDDRYVEARARHFLGHLARFEGDLAWARSLYARSLTVLHELRNAWGMFYSLEAFAYLATARGQFERAARLFGAAERLGESIGTLMAPSERVEHERDVAAVTAALGEAAFAAERARGRAMAQDEAIAYALEQPRPQ